MVDDRFLLTIGLVDLLVAVVSIKWGHWPQELRKQIPDSRKMHTRYQQGLNTKIYIVACLRRFLTPVTILFGIVTIKFTCFNRGGYTEWNKKKGGNTACSRY